MAEEDRAAASAASRTIFDAALNAATAGGVTILALHAARVALEPMAQLRVLRLAAFVPARMWASVAPDWTAARFEMAARNSPDAAQAAAFWFADGAWSASVLTYAAVHAHWPHALSNAAMLALIGAPSALRLGAARFIALTMIGAAAGAAAQATAFEAGFAPLVGASACVCAAIGALARLWTEPGAAFGRPGAASARLAPLRGALARPRTLGALAAGLAATGLSAFAGDMMEPIGWRAHIGGFLAGFLTVGALARTKN
jgi:membrane associated rhomboid family serine protease